MNRHNKLEKFKEWINFNFKRKYFHWNDINDGLIANEFIDQHYNDSHYNQVKGWLFEYLCRFVLMQKYHTPNVYLNHEIPDDLRRKLKIPPVDKGIDIVFCHNNNNNSNNNNNDQKWIAVQCKYRSRYQNTHIKKEYISDFIHELQRSNSFAYGLIMTNVDNITPRFEEDDIVEWFLSYHLKEEITKRFLQWIIKPNNTK
eukprot:466928_1